MRSSMVVDVLRGSKGSRIISLGFDNLSTYGIMKDYPKDNLRDLIYYINLPYNKSYHQ